MGPNSATLYATRAMFILFDLTVIFYVFDRISNEFQLDQFLPRLERIQCHLLGTSPRMVFIQQRVHMKLSFWGKIIFLILPKSGALELNLKFDSRISNEVQLDQFLSLWEKIQFVLLLNT
jgi:hypothetical protein